MHSTITEELNSFQLIGGEKKNEIIAFIISKESPEYNLKRQLPKWSKYSLNALDQIAKEQGFTGLRLRPYHC